MSTVYLPCAKLELLAKYVEGAIYDFGHCFADYPTKQLLNPEYSFSNLIDEPNTKSLIVKPELEIVAENDFSMWEVVEGDYWKRAIISASPIRYIMKWASSDPELVHQICLKSSYYLDDDEPFVIEIGVMPTAPTTESAYIDIVWGDASYRLRLTKDNPPDFYIFDETWRLVTAVPIEMNNLWRNIPTDFVWVIPYAQGILFSTDGVNFHWVKPLNFEKMAGGALYIAGCGGIAGFALHKVRYDSASIESAEIDMGREPENEANIRVHGYFADGNYTAEKIPTSDTAYKYKITLEPSKGQMGIVKVSVDHAPLVSSSEEVAYTVHDVVEIDESLPEDGFGDSAIIRLANPGFAYSNIFKRFDVLTYHVGWFTSGGTALTRRMTGILRSISDIRGESEVPMLELVMGSLLDRIEEGIVIFAPDYTGYTVKEMLSDALMRCGIPVEKQDIYDWDYVLESIEEGGWQPKLGDRWRDWFERVVYNLVGGWMYTLPNGTVKIEPYIEVEDIEDWDDAVVLYHYHCDRINILKPEESISEIRNIVYVQGLSPEGYPIVSILRDEDSLYNPEAENYVGYPRPLIIEDNALCTKEICDSVCTTLYNRYHKYRNKIEVSVAPLYGSTLITRGAKVKLIHNDSTVKYIIVRSVNSRLSHGEFSQSFLGDYIEGE